LHLFKTKFLPQKNDLRQGVHQAIPIAYAAMHKPDPLTAAANVVRGFHRIFPLHEAELDVLWTMIGARLMVSVVNSAIGKIERPDNEYLQITFILILLTTHFATLAA